MKISISRLRTVKERGHGDVFLRDASLITKRLPLCKVERKCT